LGLPFLDFSKWDTVPVPQREWAVLDRIPLRQPYLFTGNGAVGKSLVELMRAVAHVLGKPWLWQQVEQGPAIYLGAEDESYISGLPTSSNTMTRPSQRLSRPGCIY
jgi:RecA-family ATPase